ncbi:MAG TPA: myxosortase-dependent metalloprotease, MXAN_2677/MXAN_2678 family [Myxococcales bacterium]|nr:myxosortase-dependent metalloprotease, MXAN_2677/MXAN_2678 family [Myxococcales bacterium]
MRLSAALAALLVALPASAYERARVNDSGPLLFWATRGHSFQIDSRGTSDLSAASAFEAVRRSFATWAAVSCSNLTFAEIAPAQTDRSVGYVPGATNRNLVLWRAQSCASTVPAGDPCVTQGGCSNKYDCWDYGSTAIATTTTTSNTATGEILDADIELNDSGFTFTTVDGPPCAPGGPQVGCVAYDVQNTVTHEAGHTLGLAHSTDQTATMYALAPIGETSKRALHPDDLEGICAIYPKGGPTSVSPGVTPPGSAPSGGCGTSGAPSWEALLAAAALVALRKNHRASATATAAKTTAHAG